MEMKRHRLSQKMRRKIYEKTAGHCAYCGCNLQYEDMQVDHVKSLYGEDDVF
ncbi:HNH endonuclease [Ethanoligenens sp.]|uniref:HNH endonuclease n=1 Tax=Ethanoligenens sp. TaxID=2099655 RepID=UPI0039E95D0A